MSGPRSLSLRVFLGRHGATYVLTHRSEREGRVRDSRIDFGTLRYAATKGLPPDVLALLRRALEDLERRHGIAPDRAAVSEPPGGLQGRAPLVSDLPTLPPRPESGQGLDRPLPGL